MDAVMIGRRPLGGLGIEVGPLAFGGNIFGWTVDREASFRLLDAWIEAGFNMVDTADVYSSFAHGVNVGTSESVIGEWLEARGSRHKIVLATKVGLEMAPGEKGLSRAYIERAIEASLSRLKTDYIDLYQAHCDDPAVPLEETLAAFDSLIQAGKVRAIGASNHSAERLREALEVSRRCGLARYETLQPLYNLCERKSFEGPLQSVATEYGLSVLPYFALASGFLTGKYRKASDAQGSQRGFLVAKYLVPSRFQLLDALDKVAAAHESTQAQIAIAWLLSRDGIAAPVVSATTPAQLEQLTKAPLIELTKEEICALDQASA